MSRLGSLVLPGAKSALTLRFSMRTIILASSLGTVLGGLIAPANGQDASEPAPFETAIPADPETESSGFLFFPRSGAEEMSATTEPPPIAPANEFPASEPDTRGRQSFADARLDLTEENPGNHNRFDDSGVSRIPIEQAEAGNGWRDSSIQRPETISLNDQPWVEWHKITIQGQTLPTAEEGLGVTSVDIKGTLKFAKLPFLFVTPRVAWHFLDGPPTTDLPPRLFDLSLDTTAFVPLNDRWMIQAGVAPGMYTDLHAMQDSFRITGRGLVFYRWSPQLQVAGGFIYLGRKDITALPAIGAVYTPSDDIKAELLFPKPKVAYRYHHDLDRERWVYLTGELGGGTWAIQRSSGGDDIATYRDLQLLLGIEHKETGGLNWQMEGGYVFSREIEYESQIGNTELPATAVLRLVLSF